MSDPLGKLGHFGIAKQTNFVAPVTAADYVKFSSESLSLKLDEIIPSAITGVQDESDSLEGAGTVAGNTVHEVHPVAAGFFMRSWFGQPLTTERPSFIVTSTNKFLDFDIGSTELVATVTEGTYLAGATHADAGTLCKAIYDAIVAAEAVGAYTVTFSTTTKKFTIARATGTVQARWKTGTHGSDNLDTHIGTLLGFTDTADSAEAASITSDTAISMTYQHIFTPPAYNVPAARKNSATIGGSTTTLTDSGQAWTINQWVGWWLHIYEGTGLNQWLPITANAAGALSFATATAPSTDSKYEILPGPENCVLPPYTIEVERNIPGSTAAFQYSGLVANTLAFKFGVATKLLELTVGWLGKDSTAIAKTVATLPTTEPFKWSQCKIGIGTFDSGAATSGSLTTVVDTGGGWTVDALIGKLMVKQNAAGTKCEVRPITDNDATTITVSPGFVDAAVITDTYEIFNCPDIAESIEFTLDNGLAALPTLNYTRRISRIVGDSFRSGTMTASVIPQDITDYTTYYSGWAARRWVVWFKGQQVTGSHYNELAFLFPKVLMTAYPVNIGAPGRVLVAIAAKLKYDSTYSYLVKSWLNTERVSYSS